MIWSELRQIFQSHGVSAGLPEGLHGLRELTEMKHGHTSGVQPFGGSWFAGVVNVHDAQGFLCSTAFDKGDPKVDEHITVGRC